MSKHLKLSVKVAEQLKTNKFVEQSRYEVDENDKDQAKKDPSVLNVDDGQKQIKIYDSQENIEMNHLDKSSPVIEAEDEGSDLTQQIFQPTATTLDKQ